MLGLWIFGTVPHNVPGLSRASGTVPKARDCPRLLGLWDWEIYSMVLRLWFFGTFPTSRDCPGLLGQSQSTGTVPNLKILYLLSRHLQTGILCVFYSKFKQHLRDRKRIFIYFFKQINFTNLIRYFLLCFFFYPILSLMWSGGRKREKKFDITCFNVYIFFIKYLSVLTLDLFTCIQFQMINE